MRKIVSVLRIALVLAYIVLAVPAVVSADPADTPKYDTTEGSKAFYGNGTSFEVCPIENDPSNWLVVWEWGENDQPVKSMEVSVNTQIYAGSENVNVVPDGGVMSITLHGVTVEDLYMHGKGSNTVEGEVDLFLEDGAAITGELDVSGNVYAGIHFGKGAKITNVTGAEGRTDTMHIEFVRESGMTKEALDQLFPGINIVEGFIAVIIVGENGSVQGGKIEESTLAYTGSPLLDPDDDDEVSDWTPIPNSGYKFGGWYLNGTRIDLFETPMTEAHLAGAPTDEDGKATVTVYAKWLPVSHATGNYDGEGSMAVRIILNGAGQALLPVSQLR